ncbi:hypothetical protein Pcinc_036470, partial [Petrolisthes cinctipes]
VKRELENSLSASPSPANYTSLYDKENYPTRRSQALHNKGAAVTGKLEVRLIGVQDLLEDVPGRSRRDSHSAPSDLKSFMKGVTKSSKSYSVKDEISNDVMAVLKLDNNKVVGQTSWKPCSQSAWDQRFSIDLEKSRDLEIDIYWRDWRSLCAVKFLRLEEFIDDVRHGMALQLEPKGLLFTEIKFLNPMISRKPKLQRQKKLFMQKGKVLRPNQMNINVAAWGRLIKNIQPTPHDPSHSGTSTPSAPTPITPGPRLRLDFDENEKTPGEERHCRPLAMPEVRPLSPSPAMLHTPPPPPSITHGTPQPAPPLLPVTHHLQFHPSSPTLAQPPTIHPAHSVTVQVTKRPTSTPPPPPPRPHSGGTVTITVPASPVEPDVKASTSFTFYHPYHTPTMTQEAVGPPRVTSGLPLTSLLGLASAGQCHPPGSPTQQPPQSHPVSPLPPATSSASHPLPLFSLPLLPLYLSPVFSLPSLPPPPTSTSHLYLPPFFLPSLPPPLLPPPFSLPPFSLPPFSLPPFSLPPFSLPSLPSPPFSSPSHLYLPPLLFSLPLLPSPPPLFSLPLLPSPPPLFSLPLLPLPSPSSTPHVYLFPVFSLPLLPLSRLLPPISTSPTSSPFPSTSPTSSPSHFYLSPVFFLPLYLHAPYPFPSLPFP